MSDGICENEMCGRKVVVFSVSIKKLGVGLTFCCFGGDAAWLFAEMKFGAKKPRRMAIHMLVVHEIG